MDDQLSLSIEGRTGSLILNGRELAQASIARWRTLTERQALDLVPEAEIQVLAKSSPQGRRILRERAVSYVTEQGEAFIIQEPSFYIRTAGKKAVARSDSESLNAFAKRSSRISRWLLLNLDEEPSFRELARDTRLSESLVSRTIKMLRDLSLVEVRDDETDSRMRRVRVPNPGLLLDSFDSANQRRRQERVTWDVGTNSVQAALDLVRRTSDAYDLDYAVGGVAGASFRRKVVEPSQATIWVPKLEIDAWAEALLPSRDRAGKLSVHSQPDPFPFELANKVAGIRVSDDVQLYLDCSAAGERALEAAEAIRMAKRW